MSDNNSSAQFGVEQENLTPERDEDTDYSDIPQLSKEHFERGQLRIGGKPVKRGKASVELALDAWLVEYFRQQAGERDPAALINQVLKQAVVDDSARQIAEKFREEGEQQPVPA